MSSETKNQHFLSQTEQSLNSSNPGARPHNRRIYEFEIVDRDRRELRLTSDKGRTVSRNLSMLDLYSFDVAGMNLRSNFEHIFGDYETRIRPLTEQLLGARPSSPSEIERIIIDLFVAKMVNFARNPFSVAKVLNTFTPMASHHPALPEAYETCERILRGRRPHQTRTCLELGISDVQYEEWLRVLFMLLYPLAYEARPMLDQILEGLFLDRGNVTRVEIFRYGKERCLTSDRAVTSPVGQDVHLMLDFNLNAQAFVRYQFLHPSALPAGIAHRLSLGPKTIFVSVNHDDLQALDLFHRRAIEQSYKNVYCSDTVPYGAVVI